MSLTRWNPFGEVVSLRNELNRVFDRFPELHRTMESVWPRIDVKETEHDLEVEVEVPGIEKENIKLSVTRDSLVISGEVQQGVEQKADNYLYQERRTGSFSRHIALPAEVDAERVKATYENGVVHIVMPKLQDPKQKSVQIQIH